MKRRALALLLAGATGGAAPGVLGQDGQPFKKSPEVPLDFRGPGREEPEPDVSEVRLAWFGPGDPDHPEFGDSWRGAVLALDEVNAAGGYRGRPFRLVAVWSENPWKAGITDLTRLVVERRAWAVIGGIDGTTTHLAVQVALKLHVPLLSPGSTDATTDHANVPWLFSLPPSDERIAPVLADAISRAAERGPFAVAASTDHDSHAALVALRRALSRLGMGPATLVEFAAGETDFPALATQLVAGRPRALVVLAPSRAGGRLVAAVRGEGFRGAIVGGAPEARSAFRRAAGEAAEGTIAPLAIDTGPAWEAFAVAYVRRWGEPPDDAAAAGYDAVRLVARAVRRVGLNRALIRDAIRALAPWPGVGGSVVWNALGRNERNVIPGSWSDRRLEAGRGP